MIVQVKKNYDEILLYNFKMLIHINATYKSTDLTFQEIVLFPFVFLVEAVSTQLQEKEIRKMKAGKEC